MNRNELAVLELKSIGFDMPEIRKAVLILNSVTHAGLSRKTGIHVESVKKYIGARRYKHENQKKISDFFRVPVDVFFCDVQRQS